MQVSSRKSRLVVQVFWAQKTQISEKEVKMAEWRIEGTDHRENGTDTALHPKGKEQRSEGEENGFHR